MKRIAIIILLAALAAGALELGVTLSGRGLFALGDAYSFEGVWEQSVEAGVRYGFDLMFNLHLGGGFALGPYVSGLFFTDEITLDDPYSDYDVTYDYEWVEYLIGAGVRYDFVTEGSYRPWVRLAGGYDMVELSVIEKRPDEEPVQTESSGGNYGLEAGLGLDLYMTDYFSVGVSCEFRLNGVGMDSEVLADNAYALGVGVNLGFVF
jgi:opacity protein-like surface antigen